MMSYSDYLKDILRPLRLYDVDEGYGAEELESMGQALDEAEAEIIEAEREMLIPTAMAAGLERYENVLPYHPSYVTLEDRRRALMALMRVDDCSFTVAGLNDTLSGCGIKAAVGELDKPQTLQVTFPGNRGTPPNFPALRERIESLLPCHLAVEYLIIYPSWAEMESWFPTWSALEGHGFTWESFERYSQ